MKGFVELGKLRGCDGKVDALKKMDTVKNVVNLKMKTRKNTDEGFSQSCK